MKPLISCICITADRLSFVERAIKCFQAQTYPNKELIIYDTGVESVPVRDIRGVGFYSGVGATVGQLRNLAIARSSGRIIAHWDDDDVSHPMRLGEQFDIMMNGCDVVGYSSIVFHHLDSNEFWRYSGELDTAVGTSMMYRREVWENSKFFPVDVGEDNVFQRPQTSNVDPKRLTHGQLRSKHVVTSYGHNPLRMVATHHGRNISGERGKFVQGNRLHESCWSIIQNRGKIEEIQEFLKFAAV